MKAEDKKIGIMTKEEYRKYYDSIYNWFMECPIDYEQFTEFPTGEVLADG